MKRTTKRIAIFITTLLCVTYAVWGMADTIRCNTPIFIQTFLTDIKGIGDVISMKVIDNLDSSGLILVNQNVIFGLIAVIILLCILLAYSIHKGMSKLDELKEDTDTIQDNQELIYIKTSHIEEAIDEETLDRKDV